MYAEKYAQIDKLQSNRHKNRTMFQQFDRNVRELEIRVEILKMLFRPQEVDLYCNLKLKMFPTTLLIKIKYFEFWFGRPSK